MTRAPHQEVQRDDVHEPVSRRRVLGIAGALSCVAAVGAPATARAQVPLNALSAESLRVDSPDPAGATAVVFGSLGISDEHLVSAPVAGLHVHKVNRQSMRVVNYLGNGAGLMGSRAPFDFYTSVAATTFASTRSRTRA